jgi:hypothetical protein
VEDVEVTGVQQQTLGGNQGFASNLEGRRLSCVAGICRSGVLTQGDEDLVLHDITCGSGA